MRKRIMSLILTMCLIIGISGNDTVGIATYAAARSTVLGAQDKKLYDYMVSFIKSVAAGKEDNAVLVLPCSAVLGLDKNKLTAKDLGVSKLMEGKALTAEANEAIDKLFKVDLDVVMDAILADDSADLFWYDKSEGIRWGTSGSLSISPDAVTLPDNGYEITFFVSADYSADGMRRTTKLDTSKVKAAQKSVKNAQKIVAAAAGLSDYEKLLYYAEQICAMTGYNKSAIESDSTPYGDPWQFVSVFDGDDSTKVVCEGYSKAFKLLCDLTEFNSPLVECQLVSGEMSGGTGSGSHMWNLVIMDDGRIYMADITNCDDGYAGDGMQLFLRGCDSATAAGYSIFIPGREEERDGRKYTYPSATITYTYDDTTSGQYSSSERKIAASDYDPANAPAPVQATPTPAATPVPAEVTPEPKQEETASENESGSDTVYFTDGKKAKYGFELVGNSGLKLVSCETRNTSVTVPDVITVADDTGKSIQYSVTQIAEGAFKKSSKIKKITLGGNVETVEKGAFSGLKKLNSINVKTGKKQYKKMKKLIEKSGIAAGVKLKRIK